MAGVSPSRNRSGGHGLSSGSNLERQQITVAFSIFNKLGFVVSKYYLTSFECCYLKWIFDLNNPSSPHAFLTH